MAKRGPQSNLNDRNWDDEEEPEEAGVFKQASADTMNQRVIKKAKRRTTEESSGIKTAFGGFGGFAKTSVAPISTAKSTGLKGSGGNDSLFKTSFTTGGATSSADNNIESSKTESKENSSYLHGLKALNESVLAWINQHVVSNPYIILTPIFKDYESYLSTLESKKSTTTTTNGSSSAFLSSSTAAKQTNASDTKSLFTSSLSKDKKPSDDTDSKSDGKDDDGEKPPKAMGFTFGSTSTNGEGIKFASATTATSGSGFAFGKTPASGFSFGSSIPAAATATTTASSSSTPAATGFGGFSFGSTGTTSTGSSFGGNSGFSFGTLAAKAMGSTETPSSSTSPDDDEYVPPKPEVKEIKEDDSLFSKRCKLFYQKEGQWVEKGVGNVHVKPMEESKTQLLIRADTNLGNILLNIMLSSAMPTSRQGKNNVMLVCTPNPPMKEGKEEDKTPIPMLIRVKTGDEADELLSTLETRKALV